MKAISSLDMSNPNSTNRLKLDVSPSPSVNAAQFNESIAKNELPPSFGAALQSSKYNPTGPVHNSLTDGALEAYRLGLKTLKISMAREVLMQPSFYYLAQHQGVSQAELENSTHSLVDMAQLKVYDYVLSLPFETLFIQTTEIGLNDPSSHYWNMNKVSLSQSALNGIYNQHYDFAVYLLKKFKGSGRTFVLQDHEADWHASILNVSNHSYSENTDIGHSNYLKYWTLRQKAVDDAKKSFNSDVRIFNMCEVVRLRETILHGSKSLARDILPQVSCDLVGYSAHDTAIGDDPSLLQRAVAYLKQQAQPSSTFGANQVIISEIAVPETLNNGFYLSKLERVSHSINNYLKEGMPWVLYWQLYDNDGSGNWLIKPDNDFSLVFNNLMMKMGLNSRGIADRVTALPRYSNRPSELPIENKTKDCDLNGHVVRHNMHITTYLSSSVQIGQTCQSEKRICNNGLLSGSWMQKSCEVKRAVQCTDNQLIRPSAALPSGVDPNVKQLYDDLLGGVGNYLAGAQFITNLYKQGYTLQSLRRDVLRDSAVLNQVNILYQNYLGRNIDPADYENVKRYLDNGGTLRAIELQIVSSPECKK